MGDFTDKRIRVGTEELGRLVRDNRLMRRTVRFALALALGVALLVAAVAGTISHGYRDGLPVNELLRIEPVPADPTSPLDDQLRFASEFFAGTRRITEADLASRFGEIFADIGASGLNSGLDEVTADRGAVSFVRVLERDLNGVRFLGVAENGTPLEGLVVLGADGRFVGFGLDAAPAHPRRLPPWESALILLAGSALIVVAGAAWNYRAATEAWTLLAASISTLAGVAVLSDSGALYTVGRAIPSLAVIFAAALLLGPNAGRPKGMVVAMAVAAAAAGALAPFVRDSSLIGHPTLALADNETTYRVLLASSAGLAAVAMGGVAAVNIGRIGRASEKVRPALWAAASVAAAWAIAALGIAIDSSAGHGTLASGLFTAVTWSALALVPVVVMFRLLISKWDEVDASRARILRASDTTRWRVERDLHDGAQQRLVALGLRLQRGRRLASAEDRDELAALLEDATKEVRDAIAEIRAVSRGGQPALLAERGLATAVDALAERAPVPVQIDVTAENLPAIAERTAYYVIAEGLTNMAKHSMASSAEVSITRRNGAACVTIRDDGKGGAVISAGSGLEGLKDRVAATGGTFNVSSGPSGTTLEATIPCA